MCVGLKLASLYEAGLTCFESQGCISSFCELIFREKRGKLIIGVFFKTFSLQVEGFTCRFIIVYVILHHLALTWLSKSITF